MPRSRSVLLIFTAAVTTGLIAAAILADRRPVLIRVSPDRTRVRPRTYCVMNPFRDRGTERAAAEFLTQLASGNVRVLPLSEASSRDYFVERETEFPIRRWRIGRRENLGNRVELMYWVKRGNGYSRDGYEEEVHITVDRSRQPPKVIGFSAVY
jgi:hypothetical protein